MTKTPRDSSIPSPRGEKFLLLAGERRYLACKKLGLATIPARILLNVQSWEEILTIQLIENLQRQKIDPIDKANAIVSFVLARHTGSVCGVCFWASPDLRIVIT